MKQLKRYLLSLVLIFASTMMYAQTEITGTVVDATGEPIIGATVMEKGTSNGTITDFDGNFKLKVEAGKILVFSYIGFEKQEIAAAPGMQVTMKDNAAELTEVVVTGYQTQRKADLTGAVAVMDMKSAKSESDPNMLNSMQGKLPGVNIVTDAAPGGGGASIRVRGMSTVNGVAPLFVIDGVATTENLNSLNAADIESIQVLKDASSASIYGSRAANGVIIITTKKGKGDKVTVNVNYTASLNTIAKQYKVLNAQQWGEAYWAANLNAGLTPSHPFYGSGATPQLAANLDAAGKVKSADTDWQDEVFSSAWTNNVSASVSNSTAKGSYMLSGNYINQNGLMNNTFYRRYTARVNTTYNISKVFSVGENLAWGYDPDSSYFKSPFEGWYEKEKGYYKGTIEMPSGCGWGHYLNSGWNFETKDWVSLTPVEKRDVDLKKRLIKRATAAQEMLAESGLWGDIKGEIDTFLSLPEDEMEKFMEDVENDRLFEAAWDKKYSWFHTYQIFDSFLRNKCWKSINFHKRKREYEVGRIQEALKNKTGYRNYWTNGYDNSVEVAIDEDGKMRAWYSEEFRGCANGHYYLMFDATHAIFYEDD